MKHVLTSFALVVALLSAAPASSQVSEEIVDATLGRWLIAGADGAPGCRIRLEKDATIGGRAVIEEGPCADPWHDRIAAWDFTEGGLVLRDATRAPVITFEEQEGGPWRTPLDVSPTVYFIPDAGAMDRVPTVEAAVGDWVLKEAKGKPLCHLSLRGEADPAREGAQTLTLSRDCGPSLRKVTAWEIAEIELVLIGGEDWVYSFLPDGEGGFVSDDGKVTLSR